MFETKTLKALLNEVLKANPKILKANPKSRTIMQHAKLTNGTLEMQGLGDCHFVAETGTDLTGFLDVKMYNKTGNLATSMSSGTYSSEDYPSYLYPVNTSITRFELDPSLFAVNFQQFAKYTSDDETRACLQGIYFNPDLNEVTATNGHVLLAKKLDTEIPIPFLVAPHSFKILDMLSPFIEVAEIVKDGECKVTVGDSEEIRRYDFLRVSGDGFSFVSKCGELPYPNYNRCIPEPLADLSVTLSPEAVGKLIAALNALLPFANCETHLCIFENDEVFVHSIDTGKHIRVKIGERILAEKYVRIAFNIRYLLQVLKDASTGGSMTINYGATQISAVTVQTEKQRTLIMPLRILEEELAFEIPPEYIDVEPVTVKKQSPAKLDKAIEKFALLLQERLGKKQLLENLKAMEELL